MNKGLLHTIGRWTRSKSQRIYEWQFSPVYWVVKNRLELVRFIVGKSIFGVRRWASSQQQTIFILIEILKTIFWKVTIAVFVIGIIELVNFLLASDIASVQFLPKLNETSAKDFLGIVAQVAGVFLGLYLQRWALLQVQSIQKYWRNTRVTD